MFTKHSGVRAFALIAATAEAHYYTSQDAAFDREVTKLHEKT